MSAVAIGAATTLIAFSVRAARLIAVEEVGADVTSTTARVALEIVIACIFRDLLSMQAF